LTVARAVPVVASWREPEGIAPRGTVVVVPGRGEHAGIYERLGRRIAADGYRVWAVSDPTIDEQRAAGQIRALLDADPAGDVGPYPRVLLGSDSGALYAAGLAAAGEPDVGGVVLAGLPTRDDVPLVGGWEDELAARTACPTHQARLIVDDGVRRGAIAEHLPRSWFDRAQGSSIRAPVLGLHGEDDAVSPFTAARSWYASVPAAELVGISGGRHDALNDQTHRTAAATVVLFLERLRLGADATAIARGVTLR
jgi:alpha-beta hydrolase superfamily lysophospholipase